MNCCNPIHVDDEHIDMQLEEVWELQRQRSKGGRGTTSNRQGRINFLRGNKNRRGFSLTRNRGSEKRGGGGPMSILGRNRSSSVGPASSFLDENGSVTGRGKSKGRSRSPWGRRKRQVSINKMVEKIETKPFSARGRSRSAGRSIGRGRSRSWSLGRNKARSERDLGVVRVRSRSQERQIQRIRKEQENKKKKQEKLQRQRMLQQRRHEEEYSDDDSYAPPRRRGILSVFKRKEGRNDRNDNWSSSEEDSYEDAPDRNSFFGFR